ncbi:hypothetical protein MJA45_23615 [Paenibacillus aurantius]|uniref:Uncharacterized protein n=1 Tax=Paenibacillus aurantius TaxID=2918900 RepID=A0AA96RGZ3_9BACL|nr:hypothetical protein [Paenibacillus aurantius]WJH35305.1 hypothetical protein N6H14_04410 [Paenibacillus sp. CC-CFT747]WNQ10574.1 hypothetical protein MJA45_23615 [Paenibacillus aurantius]
MGRRTDEVKESLLEMVHIYKPKDARRFVNDFVRKYRITKGYEDELTNLVKGELSKMNLSV